MEWLIGGLLLIVGIIFGFFMARLNKVEDSATEKKPSKNTTMEIMAQQMNGHIHETKKIVHLLEQQTLALRKQIEVFEEVSSADSGAEDGDSAMNYFGEHASVYLRHKSKQHVRAKSSANVQPLDFSSHSSGLFSGDASSKVRGNE